jgi:hypothetical protein
MPDTNANYKSVWDIDQIYEQGQVNSITLTGSTFSQTSVTLFTHNLGFPPVIDGTWQLTSDSVWRQFNDLSSASLANLTMNMFVTPSVVGFVYFNFTSTVSVNVRYYIWTDEVNH